MSLQNAFENLAVESKQDVMITALGNILTAANDIDDNTDTLETLIASAIAVLNSIDANTDDIETKLDAIDAELVLLKVDTATLATTIKPEDAAATSGDAGTAVLGVRNDTATAATSANGDYGFIALDAAGRVGIADLGGSISIDDNGSSLTVDGPLTDAQLRATPVPVSGTFIPSDVKSEDSPASSGDSGTPVLGVRNDGAAVTTSADGDYGFVALDSAGRVGIADLGGSVTIDGTVTANAGVGPWPVTDNGGSLTVDGTVNIGTAPGLTDTQLRAAAVPVSGPLTDTQLRATPVPVSGAVTSTSSDSKIEDTPAANADTGIPMLAVRNDAAATKTSADGDYSMLATDAAGRVGISDLGGSISVDDNGGSLTVDGTVAVSAVAGSVAVTGPLTDAQLRATPVPISGTVTTGGLTDTQLRASAVPVSISSSVEVEVKNDSGNPLPISGTVTATGPLTDTQLRATPVPVSGTVTVTDGSGPLTVDGTITANIGTTNGLALDATLTGGTTKAIARGGAKGTTTSADVTSTSTGVNHNALDVSINDASGNLVSPLTDTQLRATPVPVSGTVATGGLTDTQLRATPVPISGTVTVTDGSGPLTVDGTVTANIGTTNGLALDATLTGGTQKSINRGGAKGTTTAADVTSTATGANHSALDVAINDAGGNLVSPLTDTQLRATPVPISGTVSTGGLTDTQLRASAVPVTDSALTTTNSSLATLTAAIKNEDAVAASADPGMQVLGVRNDAAAVKTSNDGDYSTISTDSAGRVGITDLGGSISIDDNSGSITVDGTVTVLGEKAEDSPHADGDLGMPVFGVRNDAAVTRTSNDGDYGLIALDQAGRVGISDLGGSITVDGAVTANIGTTNGLALDATLVTVAKSQTSTLTNVAASATSVQLLAANATRTGVTIFNDSTVNIFVKEGSTASTTSFSYRIKPFGTLELPMPITTVRIDAIWNSAVGTARITERTNP